MDCIHKAYVLQVEFEHVVGHTGIHGNEEANRLANEGVCKIVPVVYTAGVLTINEHGDSIGGIGVYWGLNDSRNIAQPLIGDQSLNRAKIQAICKALEKVPTVFQSVTFFSFHNTGDFQEIRPSHCSHRFRISLPLPETWDFEMG
jgi:ribonuclease HI